MNIKNDGTVITVYEAPSAEAVEIVTERAVFSMSGDDDFFGDGDIDDMPVEPWE